MKCARLVFLAQMHLVFRYLALLELGQSLSQSHVQHARLDTLVPRLQNRSLLLNAVQDFSRVQVKFRALCALLVAIVQQLLPPTEDLWHVRLELSQLGDPRPAQLVHLAGFVFQILKYQVTYVYTLHFGAV